MPNAQLKLEFFEDLADTPSKKILAAIEKLASQGGVDDRGAVFTRREVVDFILDLVGYTSDLNLSAHRILEPSFGGGDFLFAIVDRLLCSIQNPDNGKTSSSELKNAIRAVELHRTTFESTREKLKGKLTSWGYANRNATEIVDAWLFQGDFLIEKIEGDFDFVVGNPPYVRQELIPETLLQEYRRRYQTIYDRADLYIPFIERSLGLLSLRGILGFICSDRWMKNRYGGPLRNLISSSYRLKVYVDMVDTPAFHSDVIAYPAITVVSREKPGQTRIVQRPKIENDFLRALAIDLNKERISTKDRTIRELDYVRSGSEPWMLGTSNHMEIVREIETKFPTLEEALCKVGIGVATGSDKAYIGVFDDLDVEQDRKLPLVTTKDVLDGVVKWQGRGVINPFEDDGRLVNLHDYPRLKRYLEKRKDIIASRHCAQKAPSNWYRTIDRISPELALKKKLLIPDIKGKAQVVFEDGKLYPHHNLYYITSDEWDLRALQAVLLSGIARLFISSYSTTMRGGYLRFQAQYLRLIRIPFWKDVPQRNREELIQASKSLDVGACSHASAKLFGLSAERWKQLEG